MKEFVKKNFNVIILVIAVLGLFKSCGDTRQLSKISKQMETLVTKEEMTKELKRSGDMNCGFITIISIVVNY